MEGKKRVITLTFGDAAENHVGMEKIGKTLGVGEGFSCDDLSRFRDIIAQMGGDTDLIDLTEEGTDAAGVLVIRNGVELLMKPYGIGAPLLFDEQVRLDYDKKALMYGRVVNKKARWNLCFDDHDRGPDYESGKGRIIGYNQVPAMQRLRDRLMELFGKYNLKVESNYYYDVDKCGIGFHGDTERKIVIGVRLGDTKTSMPLHFQWYKHSDPVFAPKIIPLFCGDVYIMSEKAVGHDWKKKSVYTLRHATGFSFV